MLSKIRSRIGFFALVKENRRSPPAPAAPADPVVSSSEGNWMFRCGGAGPDRSV
jgi:hypothetical protein